MPRLQTVHLTHMRGDVGTAVSALRKKAGSRLKVVRNRTVGFLGRGGSFLPQEPEE